MTQEYFAVQLSPALGLALPLSDMESATRISLPQICSMPGVAPFWLGVINYQGSLLWVLDSDRFFELKSSPGAKGEALTAVILRRQIDGSQRRVALIVQALQGVLSLDSFASVSPQALPLAARFYPLFQGAMEGESQRLGILDSDGFFRSIYNSDLVLSR